MGLGIAWKGSYDSRESHFGKRRVECRGSRQNGANSNTWTGSTKKNVIESKRDILLLRVTTRMKKNTKVSRDDDCPAHSAQGSE
jgi:hypothetical protein